MKAVIADRTSGRSRVSQEDRGRSLGRDVEGVLHMPPAPTPDHQDLEGSLEVYLRIHWAREIRAKVYHNVNVAAAGGWPNDYRIPDLVLLLPGCAAVRKDAYFEGPPDVVVEIHSPGDESFDKLPFYAALGVAEVWIIERDSKGGQVCTRSRAASIR